jgi:FkbM family methyltransferase
VKLERRFDPIEIVLVAFLALVAGAAGHRVFLEERGDSDLRARYGSRKWSSGPEEWIVRDYFQDRRDGVFLDVGAADARKGSNTYFLEVELGWSGIAVDALIDYRASYGAYRPRTQFFAFFVSDASDRAARIFVDRDRTESSSVDRAFTEAYSPEGNIEARVVPTVALNDLLPRAGIQTIDFLSMDIELAEPDALAGFDLDRFTPALVCIERHRALGQWLMDYFGARGYTPVVRYLSIDQENFWFVPRPDRVPAAGTRP